MMPGGTRPSSSASSSRGQGSRAAPSGRFGAAFPASVLVLGSGIEALIAAWVLRRHPHFKVSLLAGAQPGTEPDLPGALPEANHTKSMGRFLRHLDVPYSSYKPRDGVLIRDAILRWPEDVRKIGAKEAGRVHADCLYKASRVASDGLHVLAPRARDLDRRIRCSLEDLIGELVRGLEVRIDRVARIDERAVVGDAGRYPFDFLVSTIPIWLFRERATFELPEVISARRTIAVVAPRDGTRFVRWDSVLTPYTPEGHVYRMTAFEHGYAVEASGRPSAARLTGDLNFLFPDGFHLRGVLTDLFTVPRFLHRADQMPAIDRVAFVGRYAQVGGGTTLDVVVDETYKMMKFWGGRR